MTEEDDWFERALRELDADSSDSDAGSETSTGSDDADAADADAGSDVDAGSDDPDAGPADADTDPFVGKRDAETTPDDGDSGHTDDDPVDGASDGFGADDPFGGMAEGDGPSGGDDPFGGMAEGGGSFGGDDPFGGGSGNDGFGAGDPFGGSFGEADSPDAAADGPTGFDEADAEEFETDIDRTDIGIAGLDEMILGGVPDRSLMTVIGGAGTGKTTFALQFLNEALESGERAVYITLEQSRESIIATAEEKGWPFQRHADEGRLAVVSLDPIEMANSLASIRNDLTRLIASFDAERLVLDSVSLLEMMYDHPAKRRSEVFGFTRLLKEAGVTTLLTSEADADTPYASRYGLVEYLTDGVFVLQYVRGSDFRETRLAVEIQKVRDANHSRETKPYEITDEGISVYRQANIF
ncbi:MAG: KaiC domain protein, AF_0351 family [uncultured archaeon A07HR67]|nr:MAG: KaiC domain protein, AF_0351 family [uncultured archaeon A07HR67]